MNKSAFLFLIVFAVAFTSCETPDIGVAYNPTYATKQVINLNEIGGAWSFNKIEAVTNKGRYTVATDELKTLFASQNLVIDANIQRLLRNKMEFEAQSIKAYVINNDVPVQGSWKYSANEAKLVLFADTEKSESYYLQGLSPHNLAFTTASVTLSDIPMATKDMTFDQSFVKLIGQKIVAAKEMNAKTASEITSIQVVMNYQK